MVETETALLQALMEGPSYGLELIERVRSRTNGEVKLLQGSVYPVLRQLERDGLLVGYEGEPQEARRGRPRQFYRLTGEGRRVATRQARTLVLLMTPAMER